MHEGVGGYEPPKKVIPHKNPSPDTVNAAIRYLLDQGLQPNAANLRPLLAQNGYSLTRYDGQTIKKMVAEINTTPSQKPDSLKIAPVFHGPGANQDPNRFTGLTNLSKKMDFKTPPETSFGVGKDAHSRGPASHGGIAPAKP